jgi:glycosyltransferase involved in cell wall biosynthesis
MQRSQYLQVLSSNQPIRVLAIMESAWGTGPAKNLIEFARRAAEPHPRLPPVKVTIVTYHRGTGENALAGNALRFGIDAVVLPERGSLDRSVIPVLERVVDEHSPDILQSHNVKSHLFIKLTGLYRRYPWVAFNHGYTALNIRDRLYSQADRFSLRSAYRVIAVCGPFAERLARRGIPRDRIRIQHNSVNPYEQPSPEAVARVREALGIKDEPVLLCVGRLSHEKGHAELLEAVAIHTRRTTATFRVVFAGDGPERERLIASAARLGIEPRVVIAGHQSDIRPYYALATALVLPSHTEGSPNVVLEAMAAAVPVAATRVGGVPEILEHDRTGLIVPPRNPAAMADAIDRLLQDEPLRTRLSAAALEEARRRFTPEAYRESLVSFYRDVLASRAEAAA